MGAGAAGGAGAFDSRKHPEVVVSDPGGVAVVVSDPGGVGAGVSVGYVGACLRFFLIYSVYTLPCLVFLLII